MKQQLTKIAIIIVIAIVIIYLSKSALVKVKDYINDTSIGNKLNKQIDGSQLSYTSNQYEDFAKRLVNAMDGIGTDEESVYNVFRAMKTRSDVIKLISVFGSRNGGTLSEWLYDDFNSNGINKINSILKELNIEYSF